MRRALLPSTAGTADTEWKWRWGAQLNEESFCTDRDEPSFGYRREDRRHRFETINQRVFQFQNQIETESLIRFVFLLR